MVSYEVQWKHSAEHDLHKIDRKQIHKIVKAVEDLAENPFPPKSRKIRGAESLYRIRIGDYRVIYQVDTETRIVIIYYVRHRKEVYQKLKKVI
jgi:mRNA interferase RelE/StbE